MSRRTTHLLVTALLTLAACGRSHSIPSWSVADDRVAQPVGEDAGGPAFDAGALDAGRVEIPAQPARRAYVTDSTHDRVLVVDLADGMIVAEVPVGGGPRPAVTAPDGSRVYVGDNTDGTVSVIDPSTDTVVDTWALEGVHPNVLTLSEGRLYTATSEGLLELELETGRVTRRLEGIGPTAGLATSPTGDRLYVAQDFLGDTLCIVDVDRFEIVARVRGFGGIGRIAVGDDGAVYVADERAGVVRVVDADRRTVARSLDVGGAPFAVAFARDAVFVGHNLPSGRRMDVIGLAEPSAHAIDGLETGVVPTVRADAAGLLYAPGFMTGDVFVIDAQTREIVRTLEIDAVSWGIALLQ